MEHNIHGALEEHICVTSTIVQILFLKSVANWKIHRFIRTKVRIFSIIR
jgi:hypothetical protein